MFDVVVVGGGPVGMLLAAELGLQGVRPLVLERLPVPSGQSKAGTLHAGAAQSLDRRGLLEAVGRTTYGSVRFHFSGMFGLDLGAVSDGGPSIVGSPQAWAEQVFARRAAALGAEIRRGAAARRPGAAAGPRRARRPGGGGRPLGGPAGGRTGERGARRRGAARAARRVYGLDVGGAGPFAGGGAESLAGANVTESNFRETSEISGQVC